MKKIVYWFKELVVLLMLSTTLGFLQGTNVEPFPPSEPLTLEEKAMVKVKLTINPSKIMYDIDDVATFNFTVTLDKNNPSYQRGYKYLVDFDRTTAWNCSVESSTLDSLTFLTDNKSEIKGKVKLMCTKGGVIGFDLNFFRLSKSGYVWRLGKSKYVYDRYLSVVLYPKTDTPKIGNLNPFPDVLEYKGDMPESQIQKSEKTNYSTEIQSNIPATGSEKIPFYTASLSLGLLNGASVGMGWSNPDNVNRERTLNVHYYYSDFIWYSGLNVEKKFYNNRNNLYSLATAGIDIVNVEQIGGSIGGSNPDDKEESSTFIFPHFTVGAGYRINVSGDNHLFIEWDIGFKASISNINIGMTF